MRDSHSSFDEIPGTPLSDVKAVRALLIAAAREHREMSYSELLMELGHRFTRPKMRALCRALDTIDETGRDAGEPELAALVVRESDRLPGQGWWVGKVNRLGYEGPWTGKEALAFVRSRQQLAFDHWSK
ncbi:ribose-phosphate pyrophosphokinase [Taklimakanibacter lacteus]|uniref:ribose-phosphate pyrophosphokinase n=1 Tax=Taklimakanibacter lacteus TaxID=2268456 RepID=UPI000E66CC77